LHCRRLWNATPRLKPICSDNALESTNGRRERPLSGVKRTL
jgi:hypothetical protein